MSRRRWRRRRRRGSPRRRRWRWCGSKCRPSAWVPLLLWGSRPRYDPPAGGWDTGLLRGGYEVVTHPRKKADIACTVSPMAIDEALDRLEAQLQEEGQRVVSSVRGAVRALQERDVEMGERAEEMIRVALDSFSQRDLACAESLVALDELIYRANLRFVERLVDVMAEPELREWGLRTVVVARTIEQIGDRAVVIGEQTAYLLTAQFREFTDASHPS